MHASFYILRALLALLVIVGLQLPCPCPQLAHAANVSASGDEMSSCCPDAAEEQSESEDHTVCAHCEDDEYTSAAGVDTAERSADHLLSAPPLFALSFARVAVHPDAAGASAERGENALPPPPDVETHGRSLRIRIQSFVC